VHDDPEVLRNGAAQDEPLTEPFVPLRAAFNRGLFANMERIAVLRLGKFRALASFDPFIVKAPAVAQRVQP
jgi:hypothetical protein